MKQVRYFNNPKTKNQYVRNRRDADRLISSSYQAFMMLSLMALRDQFNFGRVRAERYVDKMQDLLDSYNRGYITVNDLKETIKEELQMEITS